MILKLCSEGKTKQNKIKATNSTRPHYNHISVSVPETDYADLKTWVSVVYKISLGGSGVRVHILGSIDKFHQLAVSSNCRLHKAARK